MWLHDSCLHSSQNLFWHRFYMFQKANYSRDLRGNCLHMLLPMYCQSVNQDMLLFAKHRAPYSEFLASKFTLVFRALFCGCVEMSMAYVFATLRESLLPLSHFNLCKVIVDNLIQLSNVKGPMANARFIYNHAHHRSKGIKH